MDIALKRIEELAEDERAAWGEFVAADPALASPYFALDFAECCAEARTDTRVVCVRDKGVPVGFLPLHTAGRVSPVRWPARWAMCMA